MREDCSFSPQLTEEEVDGEIQDEKKSERKSDEQTSAEECGR